MAPSVFAFMDPNVIPNILMGIGNTFAQKNQQELQTLGAVADLTLKKESMEAEKAKSVADAKYKGAQLLLDAEKVKIEQEKVNIQKAEYLDKKKIADAQEEFYKKFGSFNTAGLTTQTAQQVGAKIITQTAESGAMQNWGGYFSGLVVMDNLSADKNFNAAMMSSESGKTAAMGFSMAKAQMAAAPVMVPVPASSAKQLGIYMPPPEGGPRANATVYVPVNMAELLNSKGTVAAYEPLNVILSATPREQKQATVAAAGFNAMEFPVNEATGLLMYDKRKFEQAVNAKTLSRNSGMSFFEALEKTAASSYVSAQGNTGDPFSNMMADAALIEKYKESNPIFAYAAADTLVKQNPFLEQDMSMISGALPPGSPSKSVYDGIRPSQWTDKLRNSKVNDVTVQEIVGRFRKDQDFRQKTLAAMPADQANYVANWMGMSGMVDPATASNDALRASDQRFAATTQQAYQEPVKKYTIPISSGVGVDVGISTTAGGSTEKNVASVISADATAAKISTWGSALKGDTANVVGMLATGYNLAPDGGSVPVINPKDNRIPVIDKLIKTKDVRAAFTDSSGRVQIFGDSEEAVESYNKIMAAPSFGKEVSMASLEKNGSPNLYGFSDLTDDLDGLPDHIVEYYSSHRGTYDELLHSPNTDTRRAGFAMLVTDSSNQQKSESVKRINDYKHSVELAYFHTAGKDMPSDGTPQNPVNVFNELLRDVVSDIDPALAKSPNMFEAMLGEPLPESVKNNGPTQEFVASAGRSTALKGPYSQDLPGVYTRNEGINEDRSGLTKVRKASSLLLTSARQLEKSEEPITNIGSITQTALSEEDRLLAGKLTNQKMVNQRWLDLTMKILNEYSYILSTGYK